MEKIKTMLLIQGKKIYNNIKKNIKKIINIPLAKLTSILLIQILICVIYLILYKNLGDIKINNVLKSSVENKINFVEIKNENDVYLAVGGLAIITIVALFYFNWESIVDCISAIISRTEMQPEAATVVPTVAATEATTVVPTVVAEATVVPTVAAVESEIDIFASLQAASNNVQAMSEAEYKQSLLDLLGAMLGENDPRMERLRNTDVEQLSRIIRKLSGILSKKQWAKK
jgi:hypothetical protein